MIKETDSITENVSKNISDTPHIRIKVNSGAVSRVRKRAGVTDGSAALRIAPMKKESIPPKPDLIMTAAETEELSGLSKLRQIIEPIAKPRSVKEEPYYISFSGVCKSYQVGDVTINAVKDVNFEINQREFAVIVGASGAGKTTVLNLLGGIDRADEGTIIVADENVSEMDRRELIRYRRNDIGFVFQFYNLIPNLTARENIELAAQISKSDIDVDEILNAVGLIEHAGYFPAQMSGGEQQRVAIARALAKNPKLLLCDEPTGALDDETGRSILTLLHKTCRARAMTVVLITHNNAVRLIADRVIVMKSGSVISNTENESPITPDMMMQ